MVFRRLRAHRFSRADTSSEPHAGARTDARHAQPHEMDEPIELVDDEAEAGEQENHSFLRRGREQTPRYQTGKDFPRSHTGAMRVIRLISWPTERTGILEYMDHSVNEWLDAIRKSRSNL